MSLSLLLSSTSKGLEKSKTSDSNLEGTQSSMERKPTDLTQQDSSRPASPSQLTCLYDRDLLRMFAEVNFIQGEVINLNI